MMYKKRIVSVAVFALILVTVLPLSAFAEKWTGSGVSLDLPEDVYVFTLDTPVDDPSWELVGIEDATQAKVTYQKMNTIANFIRVDPPLNIQLTSNESKESKQIFNFHEASDLEQKSFLEQLGSSTENLKLDKSLYESDNLLFFRLKIDWTDIENDNKEVAEVMYGTIVNGKSYGVDTYDETGEVTEDVEAVQRAIVDSIRFDEIMQKPQSALGEMNITVALVLLAIFLLVLVGSIVYFPVRKRMDKNQKQKMADALEAFRKKYEDQDVTSGKAVFTNQTECSKDAIHKFSVFHAYIKSIGPIAVGGILSIICLLMAVFLSSNWVMIVLAAGITLYYFYKLITVGNSFERVQRRVYSRGVSTTARYAFYQHAFRISGIQSATIYPYLQIVSVKATKEFIYLYYGPENAYIVDRSGFQSGSDVEFLKFLSEKQNLNDGKI